MRKALGRHAGKKVRCFYRSSAGSTKQRPSRRAWTKKTPGSGEKEPVSSRQVKNRVFLPIQPFLTNDAPAGRSLDPRGGRGEGTSGGLAGGHQCWRSGRKCPSRLAEEVGARVATRNLTLTLNRSRGVTPEKKSGVFLSQALKAPGNANRGGPGP